MSDTCLKDNDARRSIVEDLDTCLLVEAGAGSGKTHSLVERMVALVRENRCTVDRLAAVTFTRKAAAELKGRFQLALEKALDAEAGHDRKERLGCAIGDLDRCFLGTIHSFCAALLRERPVEAGLDPAFEELDEMADMLLRDRAWEEYLFRIRLENPAALAKLAEIDVEPGDLKDFYLVLAAYPEVEVARQAAPPPDLGPVRAELNKLLDLAEKLLPANVPPKGWDKLQVLLRRALWRRRVVGIDDGLMLLRLLVIMDKNAAHTKNRWRHKDDAETTQKAFDNFIKDYVAPTLRSWREHRHGILAEFVLPAVDYCCNLRLEQTKLNYQDLLLLTAGLLRENPEVRRYFQGRYTHLLVDEFQDTDPVQAEIMFLLAGEDMQEKDWRRLEPRSGALFVVGDPKQSIYRFRRADIDTYSEVKSLITRKGGRVLHLTTNFRSVRDIADWVNPVFQPLLPGVATHCQAAFAPLDPVRSAGDGTACGLSIITLPKASRHNQAAIARADAKRIAGWVRWALDGNITLARANGELEAGLTGAPRPGDFLILLRYKANLDVYARALEKRGIPFQITGGDGFAQSTELAEVLSVLKSIIDPGDPVRLVAALRGGLFGLSDSLLYRFKVAGGQFSFTTEIPAELSPQDSEILNWAFGRLQLFWQYTLELPAVAALEKIVAELGLIPHALTGELGKSRSGHLFQAQELLAAAGGVTSFARLVEHLGLLAESGVEEEINVIPWEENAVRLMNLHKAKGLEAPVVFLANPGKNTAWPPTAHIRRAGGSPRGYFLVQKSKGHVAEILGQPLDWDTHATAEQEYQDAEETRLLYVAATRARNLLVVSVYPDKLELSPWHPLSAHLAGALELEAGVSHVPAAGPDGLAVSGEALAAARASFPGPACALSAPSYAVAPVTALARPDDLPAAKGNGQGMSWGRVIHRVLAAYAGPTLAAPTLFITRVLAEEGRDQKELGKVLDLVDRVLKSDLGRRMLLSRRRLTEVPFACQAGAGEFGCLRETVITGAIDLVFLEDDGWVLVDYKTDRAGEDELADLVCYYAPQVDMYRKCWEGLTGEQVSEAGLYLTWLNRWIVI